MNQSAGRPTNRRFWVVVIVIWALAWGLPEVIYPFAQNFFPALSPDDWEDFWFFGFSLLFAIAIYCFRSNFPKWGYLIGVILFMQFFRIRPSALLIKLMGGE